ncbi:MAG TPA: urea ABC transporter permease subunit UrtB, partial [Aliidongia sp.]|nr:urea ABC transporter permease subunit UrtB [Aliidongia sp.]
MSFIRALIMIGLLLVPLTARAADDADLATRLAGLAGDGFDDKAAAIEALGASGDARAVAILKALADSRLAVTDGKQVLVEGEGGQFTDAASGAAVKPEAEPDRVRVNNRLRGLIDQALSRLTLFSADPGE